MENVFQIAIGEGLIQIVAYSVIFYLEMYSKLSTETKMMSDQKM